ncbi:MAG: hypothetical protein H0X26_04645 [Alphaproteobacteria bacterium]|nr:hypothetical protein [Alphaproteobacteria bacterium]
MTYSDDLTYASSKPLVQKLKKPKTQGKKAKTKHLQKSKEANKENVRPKEVQHKTGVKNKRAAHTDDVLSSPSKRRKFSNEESIFEKIPDEEFEGRTYSFCSLLRHDPTVPGGMIPIFPTLLHNPEGAERHFLSPIRRDFVTNQHSNPEKNFLGSPEVRKILHKRDPGNYWSRELRFEEKTVYQADFLFDPYAEVLTEGEWITNLERMKLGLCPIGHKGIVGPEVRNLSTNKEISALKRMERIELHHTTQNDTGTDKDPLAEMTHAAHMGTNARLIIAPPHGASAMSIVHSSLEKKDALELCAENQFILTNVLHFRDPKKGSFINRKSFDAWREEYWKHRAAEIKKGIFTGKDNLPTHVVPRRLFDNMEKVIY